MPLHGTRLEKDVLACLDTRCPGGGYMARFPGFYPDGDCCCFLDEQARFGGFGHPWRQEVWAVGAERVAKLAAMPPGRDGSNGMEATKERAPE